MKLTSHEVNFIFHSDRSDFLKNKFTQLYLCSVAILIMGFIELIFNYTKANTNENVYSCIIKLLLGGVLLVFAIASHVKYNTNKKQLERAMSKEYDERDDLIEGKASQFTMTILMVLVLLMMFLSTLISIPTNIALSVIILVTLVTNVLAKKYYSYIL